ncbi:aminodeoxychorismate lyase [Brevibacillus agri]|uniref:aminodeoxychorismate lyase n=1 Tax=Brevibacillus agri TaxID=51101 RepID=UPI002E1C57A0|nr:aminodeoxychorismate lyase [Brevibacillus agri]MED1645345.1 aminodeoxychorismate lyase [Brevibacillus agri]MED1653760.1 aminodeoxychorismate lyase [Brevibacillus agri]MED1689200.1 aminodeoxychorismate lyase [Brevibacillus agri]MED1693392.1 aminodeoxychorismate lyase [Brevibacillus agri]MED1700337.1 aminodeoxychorismate lyase [Brevibacillus agri]
MHVYVNGTICPAHEARVSVLDHGFLYGIGLFETMRVYDRKLFLWDDHFARLSSGLLALQIQPIWSKAELADAILQTIDANGLRDAYVRLSVTAGPEGVGLVTGGYERPSLFVFAKPVAPLAVPPQPKRLQTLALARQTAEGHQRFKSHNYLNNALARQELGARTDTEGLFLTHDGFLAEGIVSNLFWVKNGHLFTPSLDTGILDGVTRRHVLRLAEQLAIPTTEGRYRLEELLAADEVFTTNSVQEIVPVAEVDGQLVASTYGKYTRELHLAYRQSVATGM